MKNLILLLVIAGFSTLAQAQELKVTDLPEAVVAAFNKSNPLTNPVVWSKDGSNFEAVYTADEIEKSICYDAAGTVVETKMQIPVASLPQGMMDYMTINHKENVMKKASKITDAKGIVTYETEVKGQWLIFDANGTYIKSVEELVLSN